LLAEAVGKSKRDVEHLLARWFPQPDVPDTMRTRATSPRRSNARSGCETGAGARSWARTDVVVAHGGTSSSITSTSARREERAPRETSSSGAPLTTGTSRSSRTACPSVRPAGTGAALGPDRVLRRSSHERGTMPVEPPRPRCCRGRAGRGDGRWAQRPAGAPAYFSQVTCFHPPRTLVLPQ
jgi:hypothetical protein